MLRGQCFARVKRLSDGTVRRSGRTTRGSINGNQIDAGEVCVGSSFPVFSHSFGQKRTHVQVCQSLLSAAARRCEPTRFRSHTTCATPTMSMTEGTRISWASNVPARRGDIRSMSAV